jgi:hypothetical protein
VGVPLNIDARLYYRVAKQRLNEGRQILKQLELWSAAQYLSGYAVECILKALLITLTPPVQRPPAGDQTVAWLRKEYGHDLGKLRIGIARRGVRLPRSLSGEFVFVSTWNPDSRYKPGPGDPGEAARFLAAVGAIVNWADERM